MKDIVRSREQVRESASENSNVEAEVNNVAVGAISAFGVIIGLWSAACLISAMVQAGGPIQLVGAWFKAVGGM